MTTKIKTHYQVWQECNRYNGLSPDKVLEEYLKKNKRRVSKND